MSDQNREKELQAGEGAPKTTDGAKTSGWKRFLAKKWVFPATYMAAAAIILTLMWVYTDSGTKNLSENEPGIDVSKTQTVTDATNKPDALAVNANAETMQWPVKELSEVKTVLHYFDSNASSEVRQAAMIEYDDTLTPHVGVDLAREDDKAFDVLAALSGKVTRVEKDPIVGQLVEITHNDGTVTVYQSLADVKVAKDTQVKKGEVIATAGRNELEKDLGTHVHFEIRQNGSPVNPESLISEK